MSQPENLPENDKKPLTVYPDEYTVSATPTNEASEVDKMMVRDFLQALSDVALAVASRKANINTHQEVNQ
jgi:hypothetical protein